MHHSISGNSYLDISPTTPTPSDPPLPIVETDTNNINTSGEFSTPNSTLIRPVDKPRSSKRETITITEGNLQKYIGFQNTTQIRPHL